MNKKEIILYVDDEEDNLITFQAFFRRHYQILIANSGQKALEILKNQTVNLVISDQRMPEMTGVELFEHIQTLYPDIIRIVLTGYTDMETIVNAINKGRIYHYVTKPWQPEELQLILRKALEVQQLKKENTNLQLEKKELLLKTAQQEQANMEAQFTALKNQINPHFLFNSLNIINTLIHSDVEKAKPFIAKFSKLYRQLLELREDTLITLEKELDFVHNYLYLQQIRFDDSLKVIFNISETCKQRLIPPFCLQLLVENAIKHNIVAEKQPLHIEVITVGEELLVRNNLQARLAVKDSTKTGLKNLKNRYKLLTDRTPSFKKRDGVYIANLPLL